MSFIPGIKNYAKHKQVFSNKSNNKDRDGEITHWANKDDKIDYGVKYSLSDHLAQEDLQKTEVQWLEQHCLPPV